MSEYAVELRGISKIYAGSVKTANNNISLGLRRGEILCVAGENGAGKTTLMKILSGLETPSAGSICVNGVTVTIDSPLSARKLGIGMVHQHFMLFPEYTVAENIVMGLEPRRWGILFDRAKAIAEAEKVINAHHFSIAPDARVHNLSVGEMQQVAICRLLYTSADIIILDEPTSVLTEHETEALFATLRALALAGKSLFLITHKLREIKQIADRVAVLRHGELVGIRESGEIDERAVVQLMVGDSVNTVNHKKNTVSRNANPVIVFNNVTVLRKGQRQPLLHNITFNAYAGEITAFTGVGGNGLGVLEAVLGGFLHPVLGTITHNGKDISRLNIRRLRNQGLAYVPADRLRVGSAGNVTVDENMMINRRREFTRAGFLDRPAIRRFTEELTRRYAITGRPGSHTDARAFPASALSGGNVQKMIVAREIDQFSDYMVFAEPTWGLDVAAGDFVRSEIAGLRARGAAIILISTNLDEVLGLADRITVMYRGSVVAEFDNNGAVAAASLREQIGNCMQGLYQ